MRPFIIFLCFIASSTTHAQSNNEIDNKQLKSLDTAFARILKDWKAPGFAVAVVQKDKVIYAKGFGYKNLENKTAATVNTQYAIGSSTKAFTTSLLGILAEDRKVDIDKPVKNYLTDLNFYNNEMNNNVTLRDMMSHRTGVSRYDYSWFYFPSNSRDSLMKRVQYMEPSEPLRKTFQYNNFMYLLQGMVVEKITGKSWEDNIKEKIFTPLGMTNSNTTLAEWMKNKDLAVGYDVRNDTISKVDYYDIAGMAPAGSINSSVNDMAKWLVLWINGGKYAGKQVLPVPFMLDAMGSQMVASGSLPSKERPDNFITNYGLGWFINSYRGHYRVEHGGNINGFSASVAFFPSDSIGIVVLVNQNGSSVPGLVRNLISDKLLSLPYRDWHTQSFKADTAGKSKEKESKPRYSDRVKGTSPSHPLKDYVGVYMSPGKESFEIVLEKDSLMMLLPRERFWLRHYHYDIFDMWDKKDMADNDTSLTFPVRTMFATNHEGNIASASIPLENPAKPVVFTKSIKTIAIATDSLQRYTGDYTLSGTVIKVYVKNKDLYLFVPGQPEYELKASEKDLFVLPALTGFKVKFSGNEKGEIMDVTLIQPNGSFKATRVLKP